MRDKILEVVLITLAIVFAVGGFEIYQPGPQTFKLTPRNPNGLRIVTWNVGGTSGYGGRFLADQFLPHISSVLKKLDPDLILLQEVSSARQARRLSRMLPGRWQVVHSKDGGRDLAILGQRGNLHQRDGPALRYQTLAVSYLSPGKPPVLLMNLHADPYSARLRNLHIGRTADVLMRRGADYLKILAGDLNLDIDIDKRRDLFTDNEHLDVETYNYLAQRLTDVTRNTGSTAEPDRRLDYIFIKGKGVEVIRAGPWKSQRLADMDHDPVVADLQIK